jgi:hypothetical protein
MKAADVAGAMTVKGTARACALLAALMTPTFAECISG